MEMKDVPGRHSHVKKLLPSWIIFYLWWRNSTLQSIADCLTNCLKSRL